MYIQDWNWQLRIGITLTLLTTGLTGGVQGLGVVVIGGYDRVVTDLGLGSQDIVVLLDDTLTVQQVLTLLQHKDKIGNLPNLNNQLKLHYCDCCFNQFTANFCYC